jgi:hypothetical protein
MCIHVSWLRASPSLPCVPADVQHNKLPRLPPGSGILSPCMGVSVI